MRIPLSPGPLYVSLVCCLVLFLGSDTTEAQAGGCTNGSCHAAIIGFPKLHNPVESGECESCHLAGDEDSARHQTKPASFKAFTLPETEGPFCYECHDKMDSGSVIHPPVQDGECLACHSPHGGTTPAFLKSKQVSELCVECHDNAEMAKEIQHSPVADGDCMACHNPHSSNNKSLLKSPAATICFDCHDDKQELMNKAVVHPPLQDEGCLACHLPHSSTAKSLLKTDSQAELCFECHQEINPELVKMAQSAKYPHKPVAAGTCTACHDPHASESPKLLRANPYNVCLRCHDDIKKELTKAVSIHAPIATQGCAACHEAHGSMRAKLLTNNFSAKFSSRYDEDLYQLCFDCHNNAMLTNRHVKKEETNFRDGETNLHYSHVVKPINGRSCKACHELHGAKQKRLIKQSVAFGKGSMMIKINYVKTTTGGTCVVGCHRPRNYDRKNPEAR